MKNLFSRFILIIPITLLMYACNTTSVITTNNTAVPIDPSVVKGELSNGIKYLIKRNKKPKGQAEIRLVINAGSVLEDETQRGFAHFVEHMAFNGTDDFKKHEIIEYVESIGMKFGADLNAHTSFDETVYKLTLPTDNTETLEKGIHILENWAHKVSFDPEEIDKERGVVLEEMRRRQGATNRINHKQYPVLYKDSQYAKRLPIGTKENITQGKHDDLIRFYKSWYRPELMSVIAVGDIRPHQVRKLLEKYFEKIKVAPTNKAPRTVFTLANNIEPYISIESDPELVQTLVKIKIKQPLFQPQTYDEYREKIKHTLFLGMLKSRYNDASLKPNANIIRGNTRFSRLMGHKSVFSMEAIAKPEKAKEALSFLLTEANRIIEHGFTESEFIRQISSTTHHYENLAKKENYTSKVLAAEYVRHLMKGESIPGLIQESEIAQQFLPTITLAEVNALGEEWLTQENRLVSIYGPDSEKDNFPSKAEVITIWDEVEHKILMPYQDRPSATQLMSKPSNIGSVISKEYNEALEFHTWTLSNGVKVVLKPKDSKKDTVLFSALSEGGFSLANDEDLQQILLAPYVTQAMGINHLSRSDLNQFKKDKSFTLKAKINRNNQTLKGKSTIEDLEYLMQQIYSTFQMPRRNEEAFNTFITRLAPSFENNLNSPKGVFNEALRLTQNSNNSRSITKDIATLNAQNLDASLNFFHQRFSNARNFDFIFVGNFELDKIELLLTSYIATLPTKPTRETWKRLPVQRTKGELSLTVEKGLEPKANVFMKLYGDVLWSHKESRIFKTLQSVLKKQLRERLREDKSGVYNVKVAGGISSEENNYNLKISFSCDPLRVDELINEIKKIFTDLKTEVVADKYVNSMIKQVLRTHQLNKNKNNFWIKYLTKLMKPEFKALSMEEYELLVKSMTPEYVKEAAKHYLTFDDSVIAVLRPEPTALLKEME